MATAPVRIECVEGDISSQHVDAIVNAASEELRGGGGVDGAIHAAAGPGLLAELVRRYPGGCPTGEVRVSAGHQLPAPLVLHTVGPIWRGGGVGEERLLVSCYRSCLRAADEHGCQTLAFPAISCGVYGYPVRGAAEVALRVTASELAGLRALRRVRFVLRGEACLGAFQEAQARHLPDATAH